MPAGTRTAPVILLENKIDLKDARQVPEKAGPEAARAMGVFFAR